MFQFLSFVAATMFLKPTVASEKRRTRVYNAIRNAGAGGARGGLPTSSDIANVQRKLNQGVSMRTAVRQQARRNGR